MAPGWQRSCVGPRHRRMTLCALLHGLGQERPFTYTVALSFGGLLSPVNGPGRFVAHAKFHFETRFIGDPRSSGPHAAYHHRAKGGAAQGQLIGKQECDRAPAQCPALAMCATVLNTINVRLNSDLTPRSMCAIRESSISGPFRAVAACACIFGLGIKRHHGVRGCAPSPLYGSSPGRHRCRSRLYQPSY
jgi:hypothetical protein